MSVLELQQGWYVEFMLVLCTYMYTNGIYSLHEDIYSLHEDECVCCLVLTCHVVLSKLFLQLQ